MCFIALRTFYSKHKPSASNNRNASSHTPAPCSRALSATVLCYNWWRHYSLEILPTVITNLPVFLVPDTAYCEFQRPPLRKTLLPPFSRYTALHYWLLLTFPYQIFLTLSAALACSFLYAVEVGHDSCLSVLPSLKLLIIIQATKPQQSFWRATSLNVKTFLSLSGSSQTGSWGWEATIILFTTASLFLQQLCPFRQGTLNTE